MYSQPEAISASLKNHVGLGVFYYFIWKVEHKKMLITLGFHISIFQFNSKPAPELLNEYSRKVDFLKGLLEAEKLVRSTSSA